MAGLVGRAGNCSLELDQLSIKRRDALGADCVCNVVIELADRMAEVGKGEPSLVGPEQVMADDEVAFEHAEAEQEVDIIRRRGSDGTGQGKSEEQWQNEVEAHDGVSEDASDSQLHHRELIVKGNASGSHLHQGAIRDTAGVQRREAWAAFTETNTVTLPIEWLSALATSDLRLAVYAIRSLYGVTRFLHLVGMASFIGTVVLLDLRGLGLFPAGALDPVRARLGLVLRTSFWLTIVTGLALFLRDPLGAGLHSMFLPKLLLIMAGYGLAQATRRISALRRSETIMRFTATVSLSVWILVIGASTWNHVERPVRVGEQLRLHNMGK